MTRVMEMARRRGQARRLIDTMRDEILDVTESFTKHSSHAFPSGDDQAVLVSEGIAIVDR